MKTCNTYNTHKTSEQVMQTYIAILISHKDQEDFRDKLPASSGSLWNRLCDTLRNRNAFIIQINKR